MGDYRKLIVWQHAHRLVRDVYVETRSWPDHERYGLISQVRHAATSVPTDLAEGQGRNTALELARSTRVALGSANELDYLLFLSMELGYGSTKRLKQLLRRLARIKRMLAALARATANRGRAEKSVSRIPDT